MSRRYLCVCFFLIFFVLFLQSGFAEEKREYVFVKNDPIDVIIPCAPKDVDTLDMAIKGIRENGANVRRIIVISKDKLTDQAEWFPESNFPFSRYEIALYMFKTPEEATKYLEARRCRAGWLLQQFLKFYAVYVIPGLSSNILLLDADTVFLNPVNFMQENGAAIFNFGREYYRLYFEHAGKLIPGFKKMFPVSGISNQMLMQKSVLDHLFEVVEKTHNLPFWKAALSCINPDAYYLPCMSEFEIYFNFAHMHSNQFVNKKFQWENIDSLDKIQTCKMNGLHYVSCHKWMRRK